MKKFQPHRSFHPDFHHYRICSGMHIADDALFINIAAILHACDIRESPDSPLAKDVFEDFGIVT